GPGRGNRGGGFRGRGGPGGPGAEGGNLIGNGLGSEYYFLWSLERVAVVYGLRTLGNKDWFAIGAKYLLDQQSGNGAWRGNLGETVDTCFALFFLRQANLATDLTATLKGKVKDPGVVKLKAVGKDALQPPDPKSGPKKPEKP